MKNITYLALSILLFTACCKKDKDDDSTPVEQLPPITQEGKNTFGCLVDGKIWLPKAAFLQNSLTSSYQSNVLLMTATRKTEEVSEGISYSGYFTEANTYYFWGGFQNIYFFRTILNNLHTYKVDSVHSGMIDILKLDTINGIIAGTFYCTLIDSSTNNVVQITEGRFDVKY